MKDSDTKKPSGMKTVLWWVGWIALTILSFFLSAYIWTPIIAEHVGSIRETKAATLWVTAVFGTWLIMLFPLIIYMYHRVDKAYEDARLRREKAALQFKSILIAREKRLLPDPIAKKIAAWPETINGGHLVNLTLKNNVEVPNVFIANGNEILGIYDSSTLTFEGSEVSDVYEVNLKKAPVFFETNWLRLDGEKPPA